LLDLTCSTYIHSQDMYDDRSTQMKIRSFRNVDLTMNEKRLLE